APEEDVLNPGRNGLFVSKNSYDQLAFARVVTGSTSIARFPVEVYEDRVVTVEVALDAKKEQAGQLQFQVNELYRMYLDSWKVAVNSSNEIRALTDQSKNEEALKRATARSLLASRSSKNSVIRRRLRSGWTNWSGNGP